MHFFYQIIVRGFGLAILVASLFSEKAKRWRSGRKGGFEAMERAVGDPGPLAWFHCASLGEFEQGRPVVEKFRAAYPDHKVLLTFFSPSGYEIRKDYRGADWVFYLPLDTPSNAERFINIWRPSLAVFIKYEYWFNYIDALHRKDIPCLVVSAIFRPQQHFFRWYGRWPGRQLRKISAFYVQNAESARLLSRIGMKTASISGDTRFDRVYHIGRHPRSFPELAFFTETSRPILVAGSTWLADEALLKEVFDKAGDHLKMIIAPHEISGACVRRLLELFQGTAFRYSDLGGKGNESHVNGKRVMIIDGVGMLSQLYQFGCLAYVGGGFGQGIHNILEAATFGVPVFFGPRYGQFAEAVDLIDRGGAFAVSSAGELLQGVNLMLSDTHLLKKASDTCKNYVEEKRGATEVILEGIAQFAGPPGETSLPR